MSALAISIEFIPNVCITNPKHLRSLMQLEN